MAYGIVGVTIFAGSLPATKVAVGSFTPIFLTCARAVLAALVSAGALALLRQRRPAAQDMLSLVIVAGGVVVGFPLLSAIALREMSSAQSLIFSGLLPTATAAFAVWRGGERPKQLFWLYSGLGGLTVVAFALTGGGLGHAAGGWLMLIAVVLCAAGYAEGATLSRRLGGWQVVAWALVLSAPCMMLIAAASAPRSWQGMAPAAWAALAYVSLFSMFLGFVFWYRGLAAGGTARIAQLQLLQPFIGLALASVLLGEHIGWWTAACAAMVATCALLAGKYAA